MLAPLLPSGLLLLAALPSPLAQTSSTVQMSAAAGQRPVVVFDLDGTLFDNGPRTHQILVEVASKNPELHPLTSSLEALPDTGLPYLVTDILALAEIRDPKFVKPLVEGWKARFFTDAYQQLDRPILGAVAYVHRLVSDGAIIVYLTGRDAPGMGAGTVESLRRFGFPVLTPKAVLVMKPSFKESDETFKADAVAMVDRLGKVVAAFENEPRNANLFRKTWPKADSYFVDTSSNPKKKVPLDPALIRIRTYLD